MDSQSITENKLQEPQLCPYCGANGFLEKGSYAFKCTKCGVKAIRNQKIWYYEEMHPDEFEQLLDYHTDALSDWFDGVGSEVS